MKKLLLIILIIGLASAGYYYLSPTMQAKRDVQQALDGISAAVATQDREQINKALGARLADDAQVTLEIRFIAPVGQKVLSSAKQVFDKQGFLTFVDNTLYALNDYRLTSSLGTIEGNYITFASATGARGTSHVLMQSNYPFNGESTCTGTLAPAAILSLTVMSCVLEIR